MESLSKSQKAKFIIPVLTTKIDNKLVIQIFIVILMLILILMLTISINLILVTYKAIVEINNKLKITLIIITLITNNNYPIMN